MQLIQYNSAALFAGPPTAISEHNTGNMNQLYGIQSASFDFAEPLRDIEGTEGYFERIHADVNEVNLRFSYLVRDGLNEERIGFVTAGTGTAFTNFWTDERNYFLALKNDKSDI